MAYHGVKFSTTFIGSAIPEDPRILELIRWCNIFAGNKLAPTHPEGSYGNLSFRLSESEFVITATSLDLGAKLSFQDFVVVRDCDFETFEILAIGQKAPSSESPVHLALYRVRPEVMAIFHGHHDLINQSGQRFGIKETSEEQPYGSRELVNEVIKLSGCDFFNMKNHGFISQGKTMAEAGTQAIETIRSITRTV